jgi:hypothetical protein
MSRWAAGGYEKVVVVLCGTNTDPVDPVARSC